MNSDWDALENQSIRLIVWIFFYSVQLTAEIPYLHNCTYSGTNQSQSCVCLSKQMYRNHTWPHSYYNSALRRLNHWVVQRLNPYSTYSQTHTFQSHKKWKHFHNSRFSKCSFIAALLQNWKPVKLAHTLSPQYETQQDCISEVLRDLFCFLKVKRRL